MKSGRLLRNILIAGAVTFFATGLCFAQSVSPATPEEAKDKKAADQEKKAEEQAKSGTEAVNLELSEPVVVTSFETEKTPEATEDAVKESGESSAVVTETKQTTGKTVVVTETKKESVPVVEKK